MITTRIIQYLVMANALFLIVQAVRVISTYSAVYSLTTGPRRQLPHHVWMIATSYLIYVLGTTWFLFTTPNPNGAIRAWLYLVSGVIGQYALFQVLSYERRRYSKVTNFGADDDCQ